MRTFSYFNPRARVGRDGGGWRGRRGIRNFNPRARVGRDWIDPDTGYAIHISIHAPAWGATSIGDNIRAARIISIHAPAWGATADTVAS